MKTTEGALKYYLEFKDKRVENEWKAGCIPETPAETAIHPALVVVVNAAAHWVYRATGHKAVLTHLLRTPAEQAQIYPE